MPVALVSGVGLLSSILGQLQKNDVWGIGICKDG